MNQCNHQTHSKPVGLFIFLAFLAAVIYTHVARGEECMAQMRKQSEATVKSMLADYGHIDGKIDEAVPPSKFSAAPFASLRLQDSKDQLGGGLAVGYALSQRLTLEAEAISEGINDSKWESAVADVGASLKLAFPIKAIPIEPYIIGGYRRDILDNENQLTAGVGLQYGKGALYGFADARAIHGFNQELREFGNHVGIRAGAGLRF
jgi:hypothetical protein